MNKYTNTYLLTFESSTLEEIKEHASLYEISLSEAIEDLVSKGIAYMDSRYDNID